MLFVLTVICIPQFSYLPHCFQGQRVIEPVEAHERDCVIYVALDHGLQLNIQMSDKQVN